MMSERIKTLRKQIGLTQAQVAEKLNVSQSTVASWERGNRRPDLDLVPLIADLFGVSVNDVYGHEQPKNELQDEAMQIRERLRRDPAYRMLFSAADNASPEHLKAAAAMLKALGPDEEE